MSALQIDVVLQLSVSDGRRRFDLSVCFSSAAPVVALYGPSGAGKSLTLQAMAGLLAPQSGHVRLAGQTLFDSATGVNVATAERGVGYLFQDYALFPHLTVRQNVAFGLSRWWRGLNAADAAQVDELLAVFGLSALARSRPETLSGGQQQRVALARALASRPRVLLLDEPFAALHPQLRRELRDELQAVIARWRIPAVLITHDIEDVLALANQAFLIDGGRVVREVDLDRAQSRNLAPPTQPSAPARPPRPQEARLRALLSGAELDSEQDSEQDSEHG